MTRCLSISRAGVGGRREFGGADNDITPEAIAGFDATARDLAPWLDESSRLVVCRRLVREGLLRIDQ
mgnify:CR=1 FL=1